MYGFRWNEWNLEKLDKHNIVSHEAEYLVQHPPRGSPKRIENDKILVRGQTAAGAYIQVIYVVEKENDDEIFVLHARPLTANERRAFRRSR